MQCHLRCPDLCFLPRLKCVFHTTDEEQSVWALPVHKAGDEGEDAETRGLPDCVWLSALVRANVAYVKPQAVATHPSKVCDP